MTPILAAEVGVETEGWQEAVRAACQPLRDAGAVTDRYVQRCVELVEENGPYMVVAPGIALAHARPEDGARALAVAVITLDPAVEFGHRDNDPVDVVFAFASPDRDRHVRVLEELARAIGDGLDDMLRAAVDAGEARRALEEVLGDG